MRASMSSASGCENVSNVRTLASAGARNVEKLVIWKLPPTGASPKNIRSTATCAPSRQLCPEVHSGYGAVRSAVQVESVVGAGIAVVQRRGDRVPRPPEVEVVLVVPAVDRRVRPTQVLQREESRGVGGVEVVACDELPGDLVPTQDGCALPPLGLVRLHLSRAVIPRRAGGSAEGLDLVELSRPLRAVQRGRWHAAELRRALDEERLHAGPPMGSDRGSAPPIALSERHPLSDGRCSRSHWDGPNRPSPTLASSMALAACVPDRDALPLAGAIVDRGERCCVLRGERSQESRTTRERSCRGYRRDEVLRARRTRLLRQRRRSTPWHPPASRADMADAVFVPIALTAS